jgi:hypothetical protein
VPVTDADNHLPEVVPHDLESTQGAAEGRVGLLQKGRDILEALGRHQCGVAAAWCRPQAKHGACYHAECAFRADEQLLQVISGIVLDDVAHGRNHGTVCENRFDAKHLLAHHAVTHDAVAAGIGGDVAADGRAAPCAQVQRKKQSGVLGGFLDFLQGSACTDGHRAVDTVNGFNTTHPFHRQHEVSRARSATAHETGQPAMRHHALAGLAAQPEHGGDFSSGRRPDDGHGLTAALWRPTVGAVGNILPGEHAAWSDDLPDFFE